MAGLRTYIEFSEEHECADVLSLNPLESHHLARVLRAKEGDAVEVIDGCGNAWQTEIIKSHKVKTELRVLSHQRTSPFTPSYHLHISLPKLKKMDLVVQQCTELGIAHIYPLITNHTELKVKKGEEEERVAHWQRTAIEACKQSGNRFMPTIHPIKRFAEGDIVESQDGAETFLASLADGAESVAFYAAAKKELADIHLYVGPEGDFSKEEYAWFASKRVSPITLGKTVLRVETAVVAACSQLLSHYPLGES